jgi:glutaredoxin/glutathione-dependent peroxiredoxin
MSEIKQLNLGGKLPEHTFQVLKEEEEDKHSVAQVSVASLFAGKKVVLFALPGAYTPTCSARHLPGFVDDADKIFAKGVDSIVCLSVNDAFVMYHWGKEHKAAGKVVLIAGSSPTCCCFLLALLFVWVRECVYVCECECE